MDIIISNSVQSKISPFIKFISEEQHQSTGIFSNEYKTGTELLIPSSCYRLPHKN